MLGVRRRPRSVRPQAVRAGGVGHALAHTRGHAPMRFVPIPTEWRLRARPDVQFTCTPSGNFELGLILKDEGGASDYAIAEATAATASAKHQQWSAALLANGGSLQPRIDVPPLATALFQSTPPCEPVTVSGDSALELELEAGSAKAITESLRDDPNGLVQVICSGDIMISNPTAEKITLSKVTSEYLGPDGTTWQPFDNGDRNATVEGNIFSGAPCHCMYKGCTRLGCARAHRVTARLAGAYSTLFLSGGPHAHHPHTHEDPAHIGNFRFTPRPTSRRLLALVMASHCCDTHRGELEYHHLHLSWEEGAHERALPAASGGRSTVHFHRCL